MNVCTYSQIILTLCSIYIIIFIDTISLYCFGPVNNIWQNSLKEILINSELDCVLIYLVVQCTYNKYTLIELNKAAHFITSNYIHEDSRNQFKNLLILNKLLCAKPPVGHRSCPTLFNNVRSFCNFRYDVTSHFNCKPHIHPLIYYSIVMYGDMMVFWCAWLYRSLQIIKHRTKWS